MKYLALSLVLGHLLLSQARAQEQLSLKQLVNFAYANSPTLLASKSLAEGQSSLITSMYTLDDPMLGVSTLDRGATTRYGVITQKIRFPVKYYLQGKAQSSRANSSQLDHLAKRLMLKQQISEIYYAIFSAQKIIRLTEVNMQAVREFARVAEKKYAANKATQSDSMKAHFEQTRLELDLIRLQQQEESLQENLKAVLNKQDFQGLHFSGKDLIVPQFKESKVANTSDKLINGLNNHSPYLKSKRQLLEEAKWKSTLAKWEFAPDIQLQYQNRISGEPEDSQIYSINFSVPLYFWKKSSEASAASSFKMSQEYKVNDITQKLIAKVQDLRGKVKMGAKTLKIYQTSLIPQAQGAYNSSRSSYRAGKNSFLDLLDSERSLYAVKTDFYRSLTAYVKYLSQLEETLGFSVSNLNEE